MAFSSAVIGGPGYLDRLRPNPDIGTSCPIAVIGQTELPIPVIDLAKTELGLGRLVSSIYCRSRVPASWKSNGRPSPPQFPRQLRKHENVHAHSGGSEAVDKGDWADVQSHIIHIRSTGAFASQTLWNGPLEDQHPLAHRSAGAGKRNR